MKRKKITGMITGIAASLILGTALCPGSAAALGVEAVYVPRWMQPDTVIVYDDDLNYTVVRGGELSKADLVGRWDIALTGLTTTDPGLRAEPDTKVEYDLHGFCSNIYYLVPGTSDEYRLSPPQAEGSGTGYLPNGGSTGDYGQYTNQDTQTQQHNRLSRSWSTISGTGRITYSYGTTDGHGNALEKYDCVVKKYVCDVETGTVVTVKNTYTSPQKARAFYKQDCGMLTGAILDIWCGTGSGDTGNQAIKDLTTDGTLDNVYSASILLTVPSD
ncbi:MAG: hypothetical protein LBQ15_10690 [Clostridium sp.]|nr:hypothetical protein [Clostridium sp.]